MTGLIYKDFLALRGHLTTYLVFFLVYGGLCLAGAFPSSVLCAMVVLISLITPMSTVAADDMSRWNRFAVATLEDPLGEMLLATLLCGGAALLMNGVLLPLLLKYGAEKARMVSMALFLVVFGGCTLLALAAQRGLTLPAPPAWLAAALPGLLAILAVGGFALSYCIAQAVYAKKEF